MVPLPPASLISAAPRKSLGQHFLTDAEVIDRCAQAAGARAGASLIEIGPGTGAVTSALLAKGASVIAVEFDDRLAQKLGEREHLVVEHADARTWTVPPKDAPGWSVFGSLPYNHSVPIILNVLNQADRVHHLTVIVQREVALRLCAPPRTRHFGRLAIAASARAQSQWLFDIPPEAFSPPPKVQSSVVRLTPHPRIMPWAETPGFWDLTHHLFQYRRKTIRATLKGRLAASQMIRDAVDLSTLRPQALTPEDIAWLTQALADNTGSKA